MTVLRLTSNSLSKIRLYAENPEYLTLLGRIIAIKSAAISDKVRVQAISRKPKSIIASTSRILRDYTPNFRPGERRYSPSCMATCRGWQK